MVCRKITIKGRVQGVGFRFATVRKAQQIGATGYVQNEFDGSVTILVCGGERETRLMTEWIEEGGAPGHIDSYEYEEYPEEKYENFSIYY